MLISHMGLVLLPCYSSRENIDLLLPPLLSNIISILKCLNYFLANLLLFYILFHYKNDFLSSENFHKIRLCIVDNFM